MPSAEPWRLADDLWLAAHDSVNGKPQIGDWPLGVGLATGLIAELIHGGLLELRQSELFRTTAELPDDPALHPLLVKMEAEEQTWPPPPPARARATVRARDDFDWPPRASDGGGWPPRQEENRHRKRGHELGVWLAYLAYEQRAEARVIDRLSRTGLVRRQERRRLLGGTTVSYAPYDSVVSGTPASTIRSAVQSRRRLNRSQLVLAGLFLATGLHHQALATLSPFERSHLTEELIHGLDEASRELLRAADVAVGEAAMR